MATTQMLLPYKQKTISGCNSIDLRNNHTGVDLRGEKSACDVLVNQQLKNCSFWKQHLLSLLHDFAWLSVGHRPEKLIIPALRRLNHPSQKVRR